MTDRSIVFSGPMILALLAGRKVMTRRLAWRFKEGVNHEDKEGLLRLPSLWQKAKPGDRCWVKETFLPRASGSRAMYQADHDAAESAGIAGLYSDAGKWKSPRYMPRALSRITLAITATRIERLQKIGIDDIEAEGVYRLEHGYNDEKDTYLNVENFAALWRQLHGPGSWDANPEVIVLSFFAENRNIDKEAT